MDAAPLPRRRYLLASPPPSPLIWEYIREHVVYVAWGVAYFLPLLGIKQVACGCVARLFPKLY